MPLITVDRVSHVFRARKSSESDVLALDDVSLEIQPGQTIAILGPSGCGKTTLLRIIAGLETPQRGQVLYDNVLLTNIAVEARGIGMVFQNYALIPHWKTRRSVGFFLRLRLRDHEVPRRVKEVATITGVGINRLLQRYPRELSGGEKQRVAIARAFARDLSVLLLDEPFANLDAKFRTESRVELRRMLDSFEATTIYVTHDQQEAASLADRLILMRDGRIVQAGTYAELHDAPVDQFVAQFIGVPPINLFRGYYQDGRWVSPLFGAYSVAFKRQEGTPVIAGVRPSAFQPSATAGLGLIETDTPYFAERYRLLELQTGEVHWKVQVPTDTNVRTGQMAGFTPDPAQMFYFDAVTGLRIV